MRTYVSLACMFLLAAFAACDGKPGSLADRFSPLQVNPTVPAGLNNRSAAMPETWGHEYHLEDLVGHVLFQTTGADGSVSYTRGPQRLLKAGAEPTSMALDELVYEGIVDSGLTTDVAVLIAVTSSLQANAKLEITVTDVQLAFVSDEATPEAELKRLAGARLPPNVTRRLWIRSALLTHFVRKQYAKLEGSAKVQGTAFSAGAAVYHSNQQHAIDRQVFLEVLDLDLLAQALPEPLSDETRTTLERMGTRPRLVRTRAPKGAPYQLRYEIPARVPDQVRRDIERRESEMAEAIQRATFRLVSD